MGSGGQQRVGYWATQPACRGCVSRGPGMLCVLVTCFQVSSLSFQVDLVRELSQNFSLADTSSVIPSCCRVACTPLWSLALPGQLLLCHCAAGSHGGLCSCLYTRLPWQDGDITSLLFRVGRHCRVAGHVHWAPRSGWERMRAVKCVGGTGTRRELLLSHPEPWGPASPSEEQAGP